MLEHFARLRCDFCGRTSDYIPTSIMQRRLPELPTWFEIPATQDREQKFLCAECAVRLKGALEAWPRDPLQAPPVTSGRVIPWRRHE